MGTKLGSDGGGLSLVGANDPEVVVDTNINPNIRSIIIIMKTIEIVFNGDFLTGSVATAGVVVATAVVVVVTGTLVTGTVVIGTVVIGTASGTVELMAKCLFLRMYFFSL
jgi:hypothetical protein